MRDFMLIVHFLGLTMTLGAGFSNLFLGSVISKLEPGERGNFISRISILAIMGRTGLGLLILSGFALMTPYWKIMGDMPTLLAKLVLVAILVINVITLTILLNSAKKKGDVVMFGKLRYAAIVNFLIGITIVVLAVLTFH